MLLLLASYVLLGLLACGQSQTEETYQGRYVILAPNTIRPGLPYSLSVTIYETEAASPVSVEASITKDGRVVTSGELSQGVGTERLTLQIPTDSVPGEDYKLTIVGSGGLTINETKRIFFDVEHFSIFVQSDKAIYKPGQTVRFRVMAIYPNLRPYIGPFSVSVLDANNNVIQQWLDRNPNSNGIISEEMVMSDFPVLGDWTIKAEAEGQMYEYTFSIEEYILPKFEVTVNLPAAINSSFLSVPVSVSAVYTYGKPVKGTLSLSMKLQWQEETITFTSTIDGNKVISFPRSDVLSLTYDGNLGSYSQLMFTANVTETLTGITQTNSADVTYYQYPVKVEFTGSITRANYRPGLPFHVHLVVSHHGGSPLTAEEKNAGLQLRVCPGWCGSSQRPLLVQNFPIASQTGVVETFLSTEGWSSSLNIEASFTHTIKVPGRWRRVTTEEYTVQATHYLSSATSQSGNFLQVRAADSAPLEVGTQASFLVQTNRAPGTLTYQIVSQGNIIDTKTISGVTGTSYTIQRQITRNMSPKSKLIVYFVDSTGEIVLDSLEFVVNVIFDNQVTVSFSRDEAKPGDEVAFEVETTPEAFVGILTVDKSVLLLKDGNDITHNQVLESMGRFDTRQNDFYNPFSNWAFCFVPYYTRGNSAGLLLKNAGIVYITDGNVHFEEEIYFRGEGRFPVYAAAGGDTGEARPESRQDSPVTGNDVAPAAPKIRKEFPETWLWVDTTADSAGRVSVRTQFPDTITSWVGTAISMDNTTGMGVTENAATAFVSKNFFVSLNLPYSVIRGEKFVLGVSVFNYGNQNVSATVRLQSSKDFYVLSYSNGIYTSVSTDETKKVSIPANGSALVNFPIEPVKVGMVELVVTASTNMEQDGVSRFLLVEAEGVAQEYVTSDLVDFSDPSNSVYSKTFNIDLPADVVPDSIRAVVTATGDILGPTMSNLDKLLRLPTGCGEQTMIAFAPDVFIYKYLKTKGLSNPAIEQKALNFMKTGYQRELNYQHRNGSFSAWGERKYDTSTGRWDHGDKEGSTWLTAFVVRSFLQAAPYIYIDPKKVELAISFLLYSQERDGSYRSIGRIIDHGIEGGVSSGATLTAYVAIAMHQARTSDIISHQSRDAAQTSLDQAMGYLEGQLASITDDKYAMAIVTYALTLGGSSMAGQFRRRLDELQTSDAQGSLRYWTDQDEETTPNNEDFYYWAWRGPPSAAVEMTGYGLLVYLTQNDVADSVPVARWLGQQRNSIGGYSSTQDTVVGLFALTSYAEIVSSTAKQINMSITTSADSTYQQDFVITDENSIVLQQFELPVDSGTITVAGSGTGSFLLSFILHYNIEEVMSNQVYNVKVDVLAEKRNSISLEACGRYSGIEEGTGMAIMDVGLPSGFFALEDKLSGAISNHAFATKYETSQHGVVIYLSEIPSTEETCITIEAQRALAIAGNKPSAVKVYSYYKPADQTVVSYSASVLADTDICQVCPDCCPGYSGTASLTTPTSPVLLLLLTLFLLCSTLTL
ncbi:CD109 antigen-like [Diadema setosum]|uniref:CD109 antigen-like n=1 Tax=Diadema setosum TaxID=31175 RepID=UPI003B3B89FC